MNVNGWTNQPVNLNFTSQGTWASVMCNVDGTGWVYGTTVNIPAPANGSNDGVHTVQYYAVNASGEPQPDADGQGPHRHAGAEHHATPIPAGWTTAP